MSRGDKEVRTLNPEPSGFLHADRHRRQGRLPRKPASDRHQRRRRSKAATAPARASDTDQIGLRLHAGGLRHRARQLRADVFSDAYPFGEAARQAGAHPFELRSNFDVTTRTITGKGQRPVRYSRPHRAAAHRGSDAAAGMVGNPEAMPKCARPSSPKKARPKTGPACPADTQVGYINTLASRTSKGGAARQAPLAGADLQPDAPKGVPVDFAFNAGGHVQVHIYGLPTPPRTTRSRRSCPTTSA